MKENGPRKIRIVIVDDIIDTNENLAKLIAFEPDMEVVGRAFDGEEALLVAPPARPDIVLMDIYMPVMDGITATARLTKTPGWTAAVVMMSVNGEEDFLRRAELAGARGYLVKPFSADELIDAIRRVYSLRVQTDPTVPSQVASLGFQSPEPTAVRAARAEDIRSQRRGLPPVGAPSPRASHVPPQSQSELRGSATSKEFKHSYDRPLGGSAWRLWVSGAALLRRLRRPSRVPYVESTPADFCGKCRAETVDDSAGGTYSLNGIGTKLYGSWHDDACQICGSRKATKFFTLVFIPLLTLARYRVIWLPKRLFSNQEYLSRKLVDQPSVWRRHWLPVAWLVVVLFSSFLAESGRESDSAPATNLRVGDCFDVPASATVRDVQHRSCTNAHDAEVFYLGSMVGQNATYPDNAAFQSFIRARCVPAYASYTGRVFDADKTYDVRYLVPTTTGWARGDRGVVCYAIRTDNKPMTSTVRTAR